MKIKSLLIAAVALFAFTTASNTAKAQVTWDNFTPCYYVAVFISHPCPLAGFNCPGMASQYYYDVPDNFSWTEMGPGLIDQGGNYQSPSDINGLCLLDINSGATYFIDFCVWGTSGSVHFAAPTGCNGAHLQVDWDINIVPANVRLS